MTCCAVSSDGLLYLSSSNGMPATCLQHACNMPQLLRRCLITKRELKAELNCRLDAYPWHVDVVVGMSKAWQWHGICGVGMGCLYVAWASDASNLALSLTRDGAP
jgi:hypothetical protein